MDIVERLREANGDFYAHERKEIVLEAAAEIARLRAECARLEDHINDADDENIRLRAENERLRDYVAEHTDTCRQLLAEVERLTLALSTQTEQHEYPCSPHCAGYLREQALRVEVERLTALIKRHDVTWKRLHSREYTGPLRDDTRAALAADGKGEIE